MKARAPRSEHSANRSERIIFLHPETTACCLFAFFYCSLFRYSIVRGNMVKADEINVSVSMFCGSDLVADFLQRIPVLLAVPKIVHPVALGQADEAVRNLVFCEMEEIAFILRRGV